ncbi:MAG: DNA polymerase III subunit delta [Chloroflexota bacterium]|nr:DNA polymerase III subunit delta [Chloroflexota bacterium]
MFYILYGPDDFSRHQALEKIKANLGDPQMLSVNTVILNGQKLTLNEVRNNCSAAPFLSQHRLVIVENLLQKFESKRGKPRTKMGDWQGLPAYLEQIPQTTILVFVDGKLNNNNPLLKKLSSLAKTMRFSSLQSGSLKNWIEQRVISEGGNIAPQAVALLAELVGGDLWVMSNEILKLVLYANGRPINEADVRKLVGYAQETSIFALVDAILEGRTERAQSDLHHIYQEGAAPTYILSMVTRQFRLVALAKELGPKLPRQKLQAELGLKGSYTLDKTLRQAHLYSLARIKQIYDKLVDVDIAIKTGKHDGRLALELLIAQLSVSRD